MSETQKTEARQKTDRCLKIVTTDKHDIERVTRILNKMDPEYFILESKTRMNNLKTLHIAQNLRRNGCKDVQMKFYKGEVLKIQFMRIQNKQSFTPTKPAAATETTPATAGSHYTPQRLPHGIGDLMSDIDHKTVG